MAQHRSMDKERIMEDSPQGRRRDGKQQALRDSTGPNPDGSISTIRRFPAAHQRPEITPPARPSDPDTALSDEHPRSREPLLLGFVVFDTPARKICPRAARAFPASSVRCRHFEAQPGVVRAHQECILGARARCPSHGHRPQRPRVGPRCTPCSSTRCGRAQSSLPKSHGKPCSGPRSSSTWTTPQKTSSPGPGRPSSLVSCSTAGVFKPFHTVPVRCHPPREASRMSFSPVI